MRFFILLFFLIFCCGCSSLNTAAPPQQSPDVSLETKKTEPKRHVGFTPNYKSTSKDNYFDAIQIYDSSPKASQGVYRHEGLVFVIICIDTQKENLKYLEGTAMLRVVALLREKYPELPAKFYIRNRVVEKVFDDESGIYRYAQVFREKDILKRCLPSESKDVK